MPGEPSPLAERLAERQAGLQHVGQGLGDGPLAILAASIQNRNTPIMTVVYRGRPGELGAQRDTSTSMGADA
jgi:hypothetical protein